MANTYKDIVITPNKGSSSEDPKIVFSGANSSVNTDITVKVYPTSNGTLSFEGSAGQLFSITNDLTGSLFSVNDISGIPSVDVNANGMISLAPYGGNVSIDSGTVYVDGQNNRVGIGITSPTSNLHVIGNANITSDVVFGGNIIFDTPGSTRIWDPSANNLAFYTAQTERMRVDLTGNLIIGRTDSTSGLGQKLDIAGAANASQYYINGTLATAIANSYTDTVGGAAYAQANTGRDHANVSYNQANTARSHANTGYDQANTARTQGNTAFTQANVAYDQANTARTQGNTAFTQANVAYDQANTGRNQGNTAFTQANGAWAQANTARDRANISLANAATGGSNNFVYTGNLSVYTPTVAAGNVSIGRPDTPKYKLDVNGTINCAGILVNEASIGATIFTDTVSASRYLTFIDSTSGNMTKANVDTTLTYNPSTDTLSAVTFNSTSDINKKENIEIISDALSKVNQLKGVTFNWKNNKLPSAGVISQDVEKILSCLVSEDKNLNYNGLIGLLVEAIKELNEKIKIMESKLDSKQ